MTDSDISKCHHIEGGWCSDCAKNLLKSYDSVINAFRKVAEERDNLVDENISLEKELDTLKSTRCCCNNDEIKDLRKRVSALEIATSTLDYS